MATASSTASSQRSRPPAPTPRSPRPVTRWPSSMTTPTELASAAAIRSRSSGWRRSRTPASASAAPRSSADEQAPHRGERAGPAPPRPARRPPRHTTRRGGVEMNAQHSPSAPTRRGRTPGVPPPTTASNAARLTVVVDRPAAESCRHCGFVAPRPEEISARLRALPDTWMTLLQSGDASVTLDAACLRDEIHGVTNRIDQLLVSPDSILGPVRMNPRDALTRLVDPRLLVALLEVATTRLAALTDRVHGDQWQQRGRVRAGSVSIAELATLPLHRTHRRERLAMPVPELRLVRLSKTKVT